MRMGLFRRRKSAAQLAPVRIPPAVSDLAVAEEVLRSLNVNPDFVVRLSIGGAGLANLVAAAPSTPDEDREYWRASAHRPPECQACRSIALLIEREMRDRRGRGVPAYAYM